METGHKTSAFRHSFTPSVNLLVCALVAGTALVINGVRDEQPPQPSAGQAFPTAPGPAPGRTVASATLPAVRPLSRWSLGP